MFQLNLFQYFLVKSKHFAIVLMGCLWLGPALAQSATPWKFRSLDYIGGLRGEDGDFFQIQTVNGLYKKSWFLGVGTGLDYYRYRTIPLFVSVVKDLMPGRNGLFISLDLGTDLPSYKRPVSSYDYAKSHFHPGLYWGADLGYKIKLSSHSSRELLLTAGYSYKELKEDQTGGPYACPIGAPCPLETDSGPATRYTYRNQRLSVKAGISL
jgi:hypothetical protein